MSLSAQIKVLAFTIIIVQHFSKAVINMAFLTEHDAIYHLNKIVLPLVKEDVVSDIKSKGAKKAAGGKGKK